MVSYARLAEMLNGLIGLKISEAVALTPTQGVSSYQAISVHEEIRVEKPHSRWLLQLYSSSRILETLSADLNIENVMRQAASSVRMLPADSNIYRSSASVGA
jgi:hypothetical protein